MTESYQTKNRKLVLDGKGYVRLIDHMGSDLTAVNAARASYMKESDTLTNKDERLLKYLTNHGHHSPFRHATVSLEIKAPVMVARQLFKYRIGHKHGPDTAELMGEQVPEELWNAVVEYLQYIFQYVGLGDDYGGPDVFYSRNEASRRYVTLEPEFYIPREDQWRTAPPVGQSKQGSGGIIPDEQVRSLLTSGLKFHIEESMKLYKQALKKGVAGEQARLFLPMYAMYTTWRWTASLQGILWMLEQRLSHDAQSETREYAEAIYQLVKPLFPYTFKYWKGVDNRVQ